MGPFAHAQTVDIRPLFPPTWPAYEARGGTLTLNSTHMHGATNNKIICSKVRGLFPDMHENNFHDPAIQSLPILTSHLYFSFIYYIICTGGLWVFTKLKLLKVITDSPCRLNL